LKLNDGKFIGNRRPVEFSLVKLFMWGKAQTKIKLRNIYI